MRHALAGTILLAALAHAPLAQAQGLPIAVSYLRLEVERPPVLSNLDPIPEDEGRAGAELGLADNATTGRFLGRDYALTVTEVPVGGDLLAAVREALADTRLLLVDAVLPQAVISAVNIAEVASKLNELGADADTARTPLAPLHLSIVPFDERMAYVTGALRAATRGQGLSLGDRACLALGASRGATVLTTDRVWANAGEPMGADVEMLR